MYGIVLEVRLYYIPNNMVFSYCFAQPSVAGVVDCSVVRRRDKKEQSTPRGTVQEAVLLC